MMTTTLATLHRIHPQAEAAEGDTTTTMSQAKQRHQLTSHSAAAQVAAARHIPELAGGWQ